jgi:hypothetical protein
MTTDDQREAPFGRRMFVINEGTSPRVRSRR